ncbi:MAG: hypothetical protein ACO3EZ_12525 [Prochlorotrichaceae cyanobacterium]
MNDEEIGQALDRAFQDLNLGLYFQVSQNSPYLYIFINRPLGSLPDYEQITTLIGQTIARLNLENLTYIALYSRPLGEVDTDWESYVSISDFKPETIVNLVQGDQENFDLGAMTSHEITEFLAQDNQEKLDLGELSSGETTEFVPHRANQPFIDSGIDLASFSQDEQESETPAQTSLEPENDLNKADFRQYCFVDDRNALTSSEVSISLKVAKILVIFHRFPTRGKHRVLPLLGQIFGGDRGIVFIHFPDQVQQWFEYILTLNKAEIETAQIWFSRYCQDANRTLREMQTLLQAAENPEASPLEQDIPTQLIERPRPAGRNTPLVSIDARPRAIAPQVAPTPPAPVSPLSGQRSPTLRPTSQRSPARLWLWFLKILRGFGR